jgi:CheY-like chemotaxis protein
LAVIVGNSELLDEMLADQAVDAEVRQFNQSVLAAAERGANLTRQLLTFARKEKDNPKPLDLNATLTSFEKLIRRLLEENVTIFIEKAPRVPLVYVDAGRVEQVLMNLCVNARDAMPAGGRLTLRTTSLQLDHSLSVTTGLLPRGKYVLVEAEDTGTGISPEVVARIFEPFFTTKHAGQGTGLGLATVHGIVRAAGGAIDVRSELGVGTTFKVYFPAYESELAEEEPLRRERVLPVDGKRVLLCEDEETVRTMTEHILTRNGYVVTATGSPLEALAILRERRMDLLITDVIMPEMNGSQLITRAREMDPNLPVLFVSGYTAGVLVAQKLSESDSSFLRKPYRAHDLLSHAQSLVDRKPSEPSTKPP